MSKGTILLVDDDPIIRTGLQRILTRDGYQVEASAAVQEGLALFARRSFDLVITDLQMPGEDGMMLLQKLKARSRHTPVLMLTGHGSMEVVLEALRRGVSDFLTKPYQPEELLAIVRREVQRYRQSLPPGMEQGLGLQLTEAQFDEMDHILATLRAEINARSVLLIEANGSVITTKGAVEDTNISALGALVAGDFAATAGIASLIGEDDPFQLNFHEGVNYSVYSGRVVASVYLLVIFSQEVRLGAVLYYTKDTLAKLRPLLEGAVVYQPPPPEPEPAPEAAPEIAAPEVSVAVAEPVAPMPPEADAPPELFSLDDILSSGLLDGDLLASLEGQFADMWQK